MRRMMLLLPLVCSVLSAQTVSVGRNIQVSAALPLDPHFEMWLAADPSNPQRLAACSIVWPSDHYTSEVVTYVSLDRGASWKPTLRTRGDKGNPSWDPACEYGPDGTLYVVSENIDSLSRSFERIDRSTDGGLTWDPAPTRFKHGERSFLAIDRSTGPYRGWLYFFGAGDACIPGVKCRNSESVFFRASKDGGRTIAHEQQIPSGAGNYPIGYGSGVVLSDGTLVAPVGEWTNYVEPDGSMKRLPMFGLGFQTNFPNGEMNVFISKPGRPNWTPDTKKVTISDWYMRRDMNGSYLPMLAADATTGVFKDRIYAVWPDQRGGRSQIYFTMSADSGKTWATPRVISDDRAWPPRIDAFSANAEGGGEGIGPDAIQGMVAVNKDGVVGVMWFDRRDHPDNIGYTVRFRASFDGGDTFTPSAVVSSEPYDPARTNPMPLLESSGGWGETGGEITLGVHGFNYNAGHTVGFTADAGGTFHALWVGNSTKVPQLWTAPITVAGEVHRNGAARLSPLVDVTKKLRYGITRRVWDRSTGIVEADIALQNLSTDTISGALMMRLVTLSSDVGTVEVVNSDLGGKGEGAVFDFTSLLNGGVLRPQEWTKPKHVRFRVKQIGPFRPRTTAVNTGLATFDPKLLAEKVSGQSKGK
jgi:hypothetical protein